MTYRDDQDALLARADALEVDLERAKAEAERLRDENDRLREASPGDASLEALAGRADEAAAEAAARRERAAVRKRPAAPAAPRDPVAVELADRYQFPILVVPLVIVSAFIVSMLSGAAWLIPAWSGAGMLVGLIVVWIARRARIAWLRTLPYPLDRDSLATRINDGPEERRIRVRVRFEERVAEARRATIARAVTGAWGDATGAWDGDDLIVTTAAVKSYSDQATRRGKQYRIFEPAPFLRACRRVAVDCLVPVHRAAPIASASFEK